jgi:hypothetical protein
MSAIPEFDGKSKAKNNASTDLMVDALVQKAATLAEDEPRQAKVARLRISATDEMLITWQTADGREAELRVYYEPNQNGDIIGSELLQLDFCQPTAKEQARYEMEFESELDSGGDLWSRVASRIWERVD